MGGETLVGKMRLWSEAIFKIGNRKRVQKSISQFSESSKISPLSGHFQASAAKYIPSINLAFSLKFYVRTEISGSFHYPT
jgi:hypothetical protein